MEKSNHITIKSNVKDIVVGGTSISYDNIQPRVVLQRLSKDYTFGVATRSDNQPSTSGYIFHNKKRADVDSSVSVKTSENNLKTRDINQVIPPSSKAKNSTRKSQFGGEDIVGYKVTDLSEANSYSSSDNTDSECSVHSSPKEVVLLDEKHSEAEEAGWSEEEREKLRKLISLSRAPEENSQGVPTRADTKIQKAITFLSLLIDTYGKRSDKPATGASQSSASAPIRRRNRIGSNYVPRPQRNNLKDCLVRVWLSIHGQKKKKKFHVKLSQLIHLLKNKNHPLHKFRNSLTLRTLNFLTQREIRAMARVLSEFICAQRVRFTKREPSFRRNRK